jgi:hypothetical protein
MTKSRPPSTYDSPHRSLSNLKAVIPAKAGIRNWTGHRIKARPGLDPGSGMTFDMFSRRSNKQLSTKHPSAPETPQEALHQAGTIKQAPEVPVVHPFPALNPLTFF